MLFPLFPQRELADILLKREPTVLDGMNSRAIQTALHRIRLLERRISFLEKKVPADEPVILPASNGDGHRKRFQGFYEKALKTVADLGLSPRQIDVLREFGLLATDNVTGFQEGRSGPARFETLKDAIRHVTVTGERAYYISMDLQNLGGLNSKLGHTGANEVFSRIAGIIEVFLAATGKDVVLVSPRWRRAFRHDLQRERPSAERPLSRRSPRPLRNCRGSSASNTLNIRRTLAIHGISAPACILRLSR